MFGWYWRFVCMSILMDGVKHFTERPKSCFRKTKLEYLCVVWAKWTVLFTINKEDVIFRDRINLSRVVWAWMDMTGC